MLDTFPTKHACRAARVLDARDVPPHNVWHSPCQYPLYYDPLYCPDAHVDLFFTHVGVAHWLILYIQPSIRTAYGVNVEFTLNPSSQGLVVIINDKCEGILPYEVVALLSIMKLFGTIYVYRLGFPLPMTIYASHST
jgi:hypothetical protein